MTRIIIDTDPGIDDVVTLALAQRSPELEIGAVVTTYGNAELSLTTRNALAVLARAGGPTPPVVPGSAEPLLRPLVTAPETHGPTGVGYAPVPPEPFKDGDGLALLRVLEAESDAVTLVTLGPLTNLARALKADQDLVRRKVARHVGMFGNLRERGNTNRWADFNAWCDPEAVAMVLGAGLPTEMVGLDVTRRMTYSGKEVDHLADSPDPLTAWLGDAMRFYVEFHRSAERLDGCVVNDVLTVGELLHPGLLRYEEFRIMVDLDDGEHRGHTRLVPDGVPTRVAIGVQVDTMRRLLERVFRFD